MPIEVAIADDNGKHILDAVLPGGNSYIINENSANEALFVQLDVFDFVGRLTVLATDGLAPPIEKREVSVHPITEGDPYIAEDFGYHGYIGRLSLTLVHLDLN
jgi:hypothetical protein